MQYDNKTQILKRSPIFNSLDDNELDQLTNLSVQKKFLPGDFIFWEGDIPQWFYVIAEGNVKVIKHSSLGREFIISFFGPGEMFGEVAVFGNKSYPASAQALTETEVIGIQREKLHTFLSNHPRVALTIINILGERLRDAQSRLRDLAGERIEQRLANVLLMLSTKMGNTLPFTRQEIADMTGTTIETVIRTISQLKRRKIIHAPRGKIVISEKEKLRLLSEGHPHV